jgi:hypothetical protein
MNYEKPPDALERPREVLYAVQLTCASLALEFVSFIFKRSDSLEPQTWALGMAALIIGALFSGFILFMIWHGRNWARLLYLILFFIGAPFAFPAIVLIFQKNLIFSVISLIRLSLQLMAVVLLLQRPTREWFRMIKVRRLMAYQVT